MKKYIIFDLDGTLIYSEVQINKIILEYIENNLWEDYLDSTRYFLNNMKWGTLKYLFEYLWINNEENKKHSDILFEKLKQIKNIEFIEWTIEKIKELKNNWFMLFLSTGNSTDFANKILKDANIDILFEKIMWSDIIPKSNEHIEIFKEIAWDENFYKNSVSVWDWQKEEQIAKEKNIDFVHIWDTYKSIAQIDFKKI